MRWELTRMKRRMARGRIVCTNSHCNASSRCSFPPRCEGSKKCATFQKPFTRTHAKVITFFYCRRNWVLTWRVIPVVVVRSRYCCFFPFSQNVEAIVSVELLLFVFLNTPLASIWSMIHHVCLLVLNYYLCVFVQ